MTAVPQTPSDPGSGIVAPPAPPTFWTRWKPVTVPWLTVMSFVPMLAGAYGSLKVSRRLVSGSGATEPAAGVVELTCNSTAS